MSPLYSDTDPKVEQMDMLAQLNASARILSLAGLRSRYPNAIDTELRR